MSAAALRARIVALEEELAETRQKLKDIERPSNGPQTDEYQLPLSLHEYRRYGRQMILDGFGLPCVSDCSGWG